MANLQAAFLRLLSMSATAGWVILAVLAARWLLGKAPRRYTYWLWLVVLFRLVCPVTLQSPVSLVPAAGQVTAIVSGAAGDSDVPAVLTPSADGTMVLPNDGAAPGWEQPGVGADASLPIVPQPGTTVDPSALSQPLTAAAAVVWAVGLALLLAYTLYTLLRLRWELQLADPLEPEDACGLANVYQLRMTRSPFVFGLLCPRIYLPARLTGTEQAHILAHEQTHLRRGDHWIKAIGWLAVCLHWFNPLVWLTFVLMEKDMELSCDELATRTYTPQQKKEYSLTLVELAAPRRALGGCPLAFGESNIAARVKSLLDPRKPALWLTAAAVVTVVVLGVTLGSDPVTETGDGPSAIFSTSSSDAASSAVASSAASQPQSKAQGTTLYREFFLGVFNGQLQHCTKGAVLDWNDYIDALSDAGFTVYEHDGIFEVVDPEAPDWVLSGSQGDTRLDDNLVIVARLIYAAPGEKIWTEPSVSAYCVNLNAPVFTLDYNPRAPQMSTEVRTVEEVEAYFDTAFAERVQQTGTALYRKFFLGVFRDDLPYKSDPARTTLDWDTYSAALSDAGYTVHEEEGVFDVFDPETPDWILCGSLANNPIDETKVVVAHLCYLNPGEKMWYEAGAEVYCMDRSKPVFTIDFNPLSSQMPARVKTVEELEAYFDTAFAEHGLQTTAPTSLNGRYLRPGWNYFDGCGIRFAVNEEWISPEQDTQDPQQFPFVHGERTLFTYLYTPVKYAPEPLTAEDVSRFYQDQKHEIRGLTEYSIAGHTGTKLVLHLPEQDRVLLQYTVTVPDCLWYTGADGSVARMVDVTQTFLFECTYAQWPETETLADRVVTSAQLNTTLKPEQQTTDPAFVPYASAVIDAAVTVEQAVTIAKQQAEANGFETAAGECTVVTEPGFYNGQACYSVALTCRVRSMPDQSPPGWWRGYVDSATGEILWYNCTK